jgi:hypothetical protein
MKVIETSMDRPEMDCCVGRRLFLRMSVSDPEKTEPVLTKLSVLLRSVSSAHTLLAILVVAARMTSKLVTD